MRKRRASIVLLVGVFSALLLGLLPSPAAAAGVGEGALPGLRKQAKETEAELAHAPRNEALLGRLTRVRVRIANTMIAYGIGESHKGLEEIKGQLTSAYSAWERYVKVAKKPSPGLAAEVAPALFQRAEISKGEKEALMYLKAAAVAEQIVAQHHPSKGSWSTLAFYELFIQHYSAADEDIEKALAYARTNYERKSLEKKFKEVEKNAREFGKDLG